MVDLDMLAEYFADGTHPAVSGHYLFRTERVYRRAARAIIGKSLSHEPVTQANTGLRRNCTPFR
jgi:hypothetical protein